MHLRTYALAFALAAGAMGPVACAPESGDDAAADEAVGEAESPLLGQALAGKKFFDEALPNTNGRACATCHVEGEHTTLRPASVAARFAANPNDPLFNRLDADDPAAPALTFNHVKAGLIRVTLKLADNLDVVDAQGNVITNASRTIDVWRGVPSVENTAYTAPYQFDGRFTSLEQQAVAALNAHSEIVHDPPNGIVKLIAAYERSQFSSPAAALIGVSIALGKTPPSVEPVFSPGSDEAKGQALFQKVCAPCHGGPTGNKIVNQEIHDQAFPVLNADGSSTITFTSKGVAVPAAVRHDLPNKTSINLGISFGTYLAQIGVLPNLVGVDFPQYRIRFYTDATRTQKVFDLPPPPPAIGPTIAPQAFSVDPGLAATTGDPADWEAFDVPQLRGIKHTAPYFHDNSAPDLMSALDVYSRFILPAVPQLDMPQFPPIAPDLPPESLTQEQKLQLIAYLNKL